MPDDDTNPTTEPQGRGPRFFDRECDECGHVGLTQKQVPAPGGPKTKKVCPECGHAHDVDHRHADKR